MENLSGFLINKREDYKKFSKLLGFYSANFKRISEMPDKDLTGITFDQPVIFEMDGMTSIIRYKVVDGVFTFTYEPMEMKYLKDKEEGE